MDKRREGGKRQGSKKWVRRCREGKKWKRKVDKKNRRRNERWKQVKRQEGNKCGYEETKMKGWKAWRTDERWKKSLNAETKEVIVLAACDRKVWSPRRRSSVSSTARTPKSTRRSAAPPAPVSPEPVRVTVLIICWSPSCQLHLSRTITCVVSAQNLWKLILMFVKSVWTEDILRSFSHRVLSHNFVYFSVF